MQLLKTQSQQSTRSAFTLVEMLVSVTLILLMMTMFASVFQMATESVGTQRAISESDQKGRSITTLIRSDFDKRTVRYPLAFYPGEDLDLGPPSPGNREGYFYLSVNDPNSGFDDFIQFTARGSIGSSQGGNEDFFGAAQPLIDRQAGASGVNLYSNPNQPEVDDGSLSADFASSSEAAQISYFIRNGNLYRRVVLIRTPRRVAGGDLQPQPTSGANNDLFAGVDSSGTPVYDGRFQIPSGLSNDFHQFFDFSAITTPSQPSAQFIGIDALSNKLTSSGAATASLGNPVYRFGFNQFTGLSREHDNNVTRSFIGRPTQAETSSPNWNWPQIPSVVEGSVDTDATSLTVLGGTNGATGNADGSVGQGIGGNPYDLLNTPLSLRAGSDLVSEFDASPSRAFADGGPRRMEDLLLANVHEFKVEIWDQRKGRFVIPGYGALTDADAEVGDFHIRRNLQANTGLNVFTYGPLAPYAPNAAVEADRQPHVFDTWHPAPGLPIPAGGGFTHSGIYVDSDRDGIPNAVEFEPPYIGYVYYPPRKNDSPPGPCSTFMPAPANDPLYQGYWEPGRGYNAGDIVFAVPSQYVANGILGWDADADGRFEWSAQPGGDQDPTFLIGGAPNVGFPDQAFQVAYRCIRAGDSGPLPVNWPSTPGKRITETVAPGTTPAVWESFDNRRPLESMRLIIRFMNQTSGQPRQVTLLIPLKDN